MPPSLGHSIRSEWDLDPDFLTVNHGSFGATPLAVRAAQRVWQDRIERQPTWFMATVLPTALRKAAEGHDVSIQALSHHNDTRAGSSIADFTANAKALTGNKD